MYFWGSGGPCFLFPNSFGFRFLLFFLGLLRFERIYFCFLFFSLCAQNPTVTVLLLQLLLLQLMLLLLSLGRPPAAPQRSSYSSFTAEREGEKCFLFSLKYDDGGTDGTGPTALNTFCTLILSSGRKEKRVSGRCMSSLIILWNFTSFKLFLSFFYSLFCARVREREREIRLSKISYTSFFLLLFLKC